MKEMLMFLTKFRAAWLIAPMVLLAGASQAPAASNGVRDEAHFFSANAVDQADQIIQQIDERHGKDLLIETFPQIPPDMKSQFDQLGKNQFFEQWARTQAQSQGVNGVYALICKDPPHVHVEVGNKTRQRMFTISDRDRAVQILLSAFRNKQFDQGLLGMVRYVQQQMDSHAVSAGSGAVAPNAGTPQSPFPTYNYRPQANRSWGLGGIACLIIGIVLLITLVRGIFGRSGGGYYGGGGYYPPQGGAYPPAGGYYPAGGGGGGGFGRGFLGGLLGGAVGGYAADRLMHGQQQGGYVPPASGGQDVSSGPDTSFTGSGGDFGGGGGGGDFGGGGGGGDFGGGGGGDFGGGGGDSGGSGGGDF